MLWKYLHCITCVSFYANIFSTYLKYKYVYDGVFDKLVILNPYLLVVVYVHV